ncbi:hypothetical protein ABW21_db0203355 [Orbilia brochopaga]|nr:hypothetical protein ABW21_db0203355 [Drechslerella brochopaga]
MPDLNFHSAWSSYRIMHTVCTIYAPNMCCVLTHVEQTWYISCKPPSQISSSALQVGHCTCLYMPRMEHKVRNVSLKLCQHLSSPSPELETLCSQPVSLRAASTDLISID